uniref:G protein-coupled receptor n=1 Tax=Caenorhabditis tropicalis TaxID=1561998 RepID=A0A1I7U1J0_9PELO
MIFLSGPFAIDYRFTLYLSSVVVLLYFFPTMLLLSFGLIYNYMSLKQLASAWFHISVERFLKCLIFLITVVLIAGNCILISQVSRSQMALQKEIIENVDSRLATIFEKHAVFVFDLFSIPIKLASLEALALSILSVVFCIILTALSCKHFERQKTNMSAANSKNHRMMMYMLVSYVAHFLIYFSFPLAAFTMAIHDIKPFLGPLTFVFIISPAHFLGISLSVTYCLIIRPYRKVCIAIFLVLTCTAPRSNRNQSSASNSSVLDSIMRRHTYRVSASS